MKEAREDFAARSPDLHSLVVRSASISRCVWSLLIEGDDPAQLSPFFEQIRIPLRTFGKR
jgi:hypothetical protein